MLTKMLVTNKSWKRFLFLVVCEMCKVGQDGTHFEDSTRTTFTRHLTVAHLCIFRLVNQVVEL